MTARLKPVVRAASETVLILHGGVIHVSGLPLIHTGAGTENVLRAVLQRGRAAASSAACPIMMRIALPDGQVDCHLVSGWSGAVPQEIGLHMVRPDPRWEDPVPERHGLRGAVRAAERGGDFEAAEVTAGRLAARLHTDLGIHPHAVLALELHAQLAAAAYRWDVASGLYATASRARHFLGAPGDGEAAAARHAVAAWLHTTGQPEARDAGLRLAHTLIAQCPQPPDLLAPLLRRLAEQVPHRTRETT